MKPDFVEINLIGTGGGYGESLVIHIGNNEWIVIDSCTNPATGECLPLEFLKKRSINLENVKLIICSHWHDDHIQGISDLLEKAPNALFSFGQTTDQMKFLRLVSLDYQKAEYSPSNSSTIEFNKCLDIVKDRGNGIKSYPDRLLFTTSNNEEAINVYSLSPSDYSIQLFDEEISRLIDTYGRRKKIPYESPNERSVVVLLQCGSHNILLGADLETNPHPNLGWSAIIEKSQVIKSSSKSSYFKIPHHGSETGYLQDIWSDLLITEPNGTLTPWNRSTKLPKENMLQKYALLTNQLHMTSKVFGKSKPKRRERKTEKIINTFNDTVQEVHYDYGVITSTLDFSDPSANWNTTLEGSAFKVN